MGGTFELEVPVNLKSDGCARREQGQPPQQHNATYSVWALRGYNTMGEKKGNPTKDKPIFTQAKSSEALFCF